MEKSRQPTDHHSRSLRSGLTAPVHPAALLLLLVQIGDLLDLVKEVDEGALAKSLLYISDLSLKQVRIQEDRGGYNELGRLAILENQLPQALPLRR